MKNTVNIVFAFLIACAVVSLSKRGYTVTRWDADIMKEAPVSSGAITGLSPKATNVLAVYASSDTAASATNWFVLLDTNVVVGSSIGDFASVNYRIPAHFFPVLVSTGAGYQQPIYKVADFGEDGISFSTVPYVYKTAATSGQALRLFLRLRQ